ncbi:MAG: DUF3352 domain-containing protein [Chlamydiae bacterium]|nr:DUF3352 domain-containing protein [Chlamydiota bacterium]MBI3276758.1 DUF3352 domain-containing protein [Chlamydiota bacterium]
MKKGILAIGAVGVVAVGIVIALKFTKQKTSEMGAPSGVEKSVTQMESFKGEVAIADVIPSDVVLFLSARNARSTWDLVKSSNFWKQVADLKIWEAAQIVSNLNTMKEQFKTNMGFDLSEENVLGVFGQDLSIALVGSKEGLANPQILLLAQTDPRADFKGKVDTLLEKVKGTVTVETVEYNGQKISRVRNPQVAGPEFNYAFIQNVFALAIGIDDSGIRKVADLVSKKSSESLGTNEQYKSALGLLKMSGDLRGIAFVNMAKIIDLIKALPAPEGAPAGFTEGLEKTLGTIKSISAAVGFDQGMRVKLFFSKNKEMPESDILSGWESQPKEAESLKYLPEDSLLLTISNSIDFSKIWDGWQKNIQTQNPEQGKTIIEGVEKFEKDSGLRIKEDILSWLGGEVCFSLTQVDMGGLFPFPHLILLAEVQDPQRALATMEKLGDYIIRTSAPSGVSSGAPATESSQSDTSAATSEPGAVSNPPLGKVKVGNEDYQGIELHFLEIPLPYQTLNPSYAIVNGFLVIGINKESVKSVIDVAKGNAKPVKDNKVYGSATSNFSPKSNQIAFLNMDKTLNTIIEITKWADNLQKGRGEAGAQTDKVIEESVIPLLQSMKIFKSIAVEAVNQDQGIEETMYIQMEDLKESK